MSVSVDLKPGPLVRALNAVGGPGDKLLRSKANRVATLARGYAAGHGSIPQGIKVENPSRGSVRIVSTNPNTLYVHEGTRPHIIRPRRPGGLLRFVVDGRVVYARRVRHPGYPGDPFLTRALQNTR